ncbi:unnamed protein product [Arctogadus glacialis]
MAPQGDLPWLLQPPSSSTDPNVILWCPGAGGSPDIQMFSGNTGGASSVINDPHSHSLPPTLRCSTFSIAFLVHRAISLYSFLCVWHHLNRETYEGPAGQTSEGPAGQTYEGPAGGGSSVSEKKREEKGWVMDCRPSRPTSPLMGSMDLGAGVCQALCAAAAALCSSVVTEWTGGRSIRQEECDTARHPPPPLHDVQTAPLCY